jgi:hypothetical protein
MDNRVSMLSDEDEALLKEAAIKDRIAAILKLDNSDNWDVLDSEGDVYLIHHKEGASLYHYGHLRGVVVDVKAGLVLSTPFPTPIIAVVKEWKDSDGVYSVTDVNGIEHTIPQERVVSTRRSFEGVIIRVIKHGGKVYFMTYKRLYAGKARWASSPTFLDMYTEAKGPTADELFDKDKLYSPFSYIFLVVHPALLTATRQHVTAPYVVYLGSNTEWNGSPYSSVEEQSNFTFTDHVDVGSVVSEPCRHVSRTLSNDEVNQFLDTGYWQIGGKLGTGEAIMLHYNDEHQRLRCLVLHSVAYDWRYTMRNNQASNYHQFMTLITDANIPAASFREWLSRCKWPYLPMGHVAEREVIRQCEEGVADPGYKGDQLPFFNGDWQPSGPKERLRFIWMNYVLSVPICQRGEVLTFLKRYAEEKAELVEWLQGLAHQKKHTSPLSIRVNQILTAAARTTPIHFDVNRNIRSLIDKEYGDSLHRLIKEMKRTKRLAVTAKE